MVQELRVQGFMVTSWRDRWPEAIHTMATWIKVGVVLIEN
jgi:NADPH-dependent curcumin reductase CurA